MKVFRAVLFCFFLLPLVFTHAQTVTVVESTPEFVTFDVSFDGLFTIQDTVILGRSFQFIEGVGFGGREVGEPWLPEVYVSLGIPYGAVPKVSVLSSVKEVMKEKFILPYPDDETYFNGYSVDMMKPDIYSANALFPASITKSFPSYIMRYANIFETGISPFQFNPVSRELIYYRSVRVKVTYNDGGNVTAVIPRDDPFTKEFLQGGVINPDAALNWVGTPVESDKPSSAESDWYDPAKNWIKVFLKEKGVYRLTFEELVSAGALLGQGVPSGRLELLCNGMPVSLDVVDGNDGKFEPGDYFQFVGGPARATPYAKQNIYNLTNVYWFSYESIEGGKRFTIRDGLPNNNFGQTVTGNYQTDFYERDSLYEKLGYAQNNNRDYWFWGKSAFQGGRTTSYFHGFFDPFYQPYLEDSVQLTVNMHGITNFSCTPNHSVDVYINAWKIGEQKWSYQESATFTKKFKVSSTGVNIYPAGNFVKVYCDGDVCGDASTKSDEIRVNWFEIGYQAYNITMGNHFYFTTLANKRGALRYNVWRWAKNTMKIYNATENRLIINPEVTHNEYSTVYFVDTTRTQTDFYCVADDYYETPDSLVKDVPSNYFAETNAADYIIITHPKFMEVAERLKAMREADFPDSTIQNPRVFIATTDQIYDEFSFGLLDPYALQKFVRNSFNTWQQPSPSYVVLIGDMSYDYRQLLPGSRKSYVPSIPYHSLTYGQAASDNLIAAVQFNDIVPDLAIGRISIEEVFEGNNWLDKIEQYPLDPAKRWKETILLMASGVNLADEIRFGFNDQSFGLYNSYIKPYGYVGNLVFRFPSKPEHMLFEGSTPEIRRYFDEGAVLASYYGHGGGYQWDLTFLNDDIYFLQNAGRLPFVVSVTCYTAHFDNQDVFGEQFCKVPNTGAVSFFGSSGLTHWEVGTYFNNLFFNEVFLRYNLVSGKAILRAKTRMPTYGYYANQVVLLTLLGDPALKLALPLKPDFTIKPEYMAVSPDSPLKGDTVTVDVHLENYGRLASDSVVVQLDFSSPDSSGTVGTKTIPVFGNADSVSFKWGTSVDGLITLTAKINMDGRVPEEDLSDNSASIQFAVYNISEPSIVHPVDGFTSTGNTISFLFSDIGAYIGKNLQYQIEIDTSKYFTQPFLQTGSLNPANGLLRYTSPPLSGKSYFWRARIFDGQEYGRWSSVRSFAFGTERNQNFILAEDQLKRFDLFNLIFDSQKKTISLNTLFNPPMPRNETLLEEIPLYTIPQVDSIGLNCLTTDGTYLYIADYWYESLFYNPSGKSEIHKVGTGKNGTIQGHYYGTIPNFRERIQRSMFYFSDGNIYYANGNSDRLTKLNPQTGATEDVLVPGIRTWQGGKVEYGQQLLTADSQYVYNLGIMDTLSSKRYVLKIFDPRNNWAVVQDRVYDNILAYSGLIHFFVADGYFYPYEDLVSGFMRRIDIETGFYSQEWLTWFSPFPRDFVRFGAWSYDWQNNLVYANIFRRRGTPIDKQVAVFKGRYLDAKGSALSPAVGPAKEWGRLSFDIETQNSSGQYFVTVEKFDDHTRSWDTLTTTTVSPVSLQSVDPEQYTQIRAKVEFVDSSFTSTNSLQLKKYEVDYTPQPEVFTPPQAYTFTPDSVLQGLPMTMTYDVANLSYQPVDSVNVQLFLDTYQTPFFTQKINFPPDTTLHLSYNYSTAPYIFKHKVLSIIEVPEKEMYTFNNLSADSFFVARDSVKPVFDITIDGERILDGDIIRNNPDIFITLKDNSPLPLDTTLFTVLFDNTPLSYSREDLRFNYTPYPNSEATILWTPQLEGGRHTLDIIAKDASNNFFDTTYHRTVFRVYDEDDITQMYNYPNPFSDDTHFTFELRGQNIPDEMRIKIFTVAGRLIKEMTIPPASTQIGFNTIYWDGRDQDGDELANGVYFYRLVAKYAEKTKIFTEKIVKMK